MNNCHIIPTLEQLKALPCEERGYTLPDNLENILSEITDDFFELAFQTPVIKGNFALQFKDTNCFVCVPRTVIDNVCCPQHNTGMGKNVAEFLKYPHMIYWKQGMIWVGKTHFKIRKSILVRNIKL